MKKGCTVNSVVVQRSSSVLSCLSVLPSLIGRYLSCKRFFVVFISLKAEINPNSIKTQFLPLRTSPLSK
jgi:hypothetical protein